MDAWLKTHVAEISPTAGALYMAKGDIAQLKRNREALVVMIRAIREELPDHIKIAVQSLIIGRIEAIYDGRTVFANGSA